MKDSKNTGLKATASIARLLETVFPDISPGLLKDEKFLQLVRAYLADGENDSGKAGKLLSRTDKSFLDALNGMKLVAKTMKLASVDELLVFLEEKKRAQRARIFGTRPEPGPNVKARGRRPKSSLSKAISMLQVQGLSIGLKKEKEIGSLQEIEDTLKIIDPNEQSKATGGNGSLPAIARLRPRLARQR